ncbi:MULTISPECIES: serine hydrolase domain-containing protein [Desulfococcus]|uniref:Beta-lactamase n=1 Tax=Desulfococcus multivorans DSM 2059 TaxID=1121405 RepID=S7TQX3_DESML|nr:serine hydrolase domain-containing protein [Desulfococcus multivorans]AOY57976.1 beta-lactamase [Desulfococcus multivorans]AQV02903.2 hypothetical protein B2D07_05860 [Desulfococcus multivorans]EPR39060.1 beta-lactamase [Desulfococcus multivorans DSM 2059]SJZ63944.1 CubicO group peptidase, beta-lactamase class C family [Desulfococcus multivorans DSM 2059]
MNPVHRRMTAGLEAGIFPGAVLLVAEGERILFHRAYGVASIFSGGPVRTDTLFDLASLTKPLATAAAVMKLLEKRGLAFHDPIIKILPEFAHTDKDGITIFQLLTHTSGLPAYRPYYRMLRHIPQNGRKSALRHLLQAQPLADRPGRNTVYSDIGYMILEWLIERFAQTSLDDYLKTAIYGPLAVDSLFFPGKDGISFPKTVAATEFCPWRNVLLVGRVHDDNADLVGGLCGHAGLFGTAQGVHQLLCHMLCVYQGGDGVFRRDLVEPFFSPCRFSGRPPGFDRPQGPYSSAGRYFSPNTIGHLGFTGTSFWMDLDRRAIVVLLTNRVHPSRDNLGIRAFRPLLHDVVMNTFFRCGDT